MFLTGNCGPNAHQTLAAANIVVSVGCSGPIREVIEQFKANQLAASSGPNVASHYGTSAAFDPNQQTGVREDTTSFNQGVGRGGGGRGMGQGRGMGMGRGGGGRGMGMGRGGGQGMGGRAGFAESPIPPQESTQDELAILKQQAEILSRQMHGIQEHIQQTEQKTQQPMTAKVDAETCAGCGVCVGACPLEIIRLCEGKILIDSSQCTGCGACVDICPIGAISLKELREKGTL